MSLRDELNKYNVNRAPDALRLAGGAALGVGDLLNALIAAMTATESGIVPAANVATLANQPQVLFNVKATAETGATHTKKLLIGPITGPNAIVPAAGQCVWDGGKKVLFNTVDAVTAVSFYYSQATDTTVSVLQRDIGVSP